MSLATRCTACGTVFRVVQDQLKVSEGWVRCGRCNEVFNAFEGLFDLDREAPPVGADEQGAASAASPVATTSEAQAGIATAGAEEESAAPVPAPPDPDQPLELFELSASSDPHEPPDRHDEGSSLVDRLNTHLFGLHRGDHGATTIDKRDRLEFSDARFDTNLLTDEAPADDALEASPTLESERRDAPAPEFLRSAQRAARWQRPGVRRTLGAGLQNR